jgi:uncharacterized cupin superfamily protein
MTSPENPSAVRALDVPEPAVQTRYPEPFASLVRGRRKRRLGDAFGLETFGVNLVRMAPGSVSSVPHHHSAEDEFVYVLSGSLVLLTDAVETPLLAGKCAGFKAGSRVAHQLRNASEFEATFLEVGTRLDNDDVVYPFHDLALQREGSDYVFTDKGGRRLPSGGTP